jgi:hypothetical protein
MLPDLYSYLQLQCQEIHSCKYMIRFIVSTTSSSLAHRTHHHLLAIGGTNVSFVRNAFFITWRRTRPFLQTKIWTQKNWRCKRTQTNRRCNIVDESTLIFLEQRGRNKTIMAELWPYRTRHSNFHPTLNCSSWLFIINLCWCIIRRMTWQGSCGSLSGLTLVMVVSDAFRLNDDPDFHLGGE